MKENDEYYLDYDGNECDFPDVEYFEFYTIFDKCQNRYYSSLDLLLYYIVEDDDDWRTYEEDHGKTKEEVLNSEPYKLALRKHKIIKYNERKR
jgi:hypothetical protein